MSQLADLNFDDLRTYVRDLLHERGPAGTDIDQFRQELPYHPLLRHYQQASDGLRDRLNRVGLALLEETAAETWPVESLHYLLTFIEEGRMESGIEALKSIVSSGAWLERPGGRQLQMLALRTLLGLGWLGDPNFWLRQGRLLAGEYPELIFRALVAHDVELAFEHLGEFAAWPAQAAHILRLYPSLIERHSLETVRALTSRAAAKLDPEVMIKIDAWFRQRGYGSIAPSVGENSKTQAEAESESWEPGGEHFRAAGRTSWDSAEAEDTWTLGTADPEQWAGALRDMVITPGAMDGARIPTILPTEAPF